MTEFWDHMPRPNRFDEQGQIPSIAADLIRGWYAANGDWLERFKAEALAHLPRRDPAAVRRQIDELIRVALDRDARHFAQFVYRGQTQRSEFRISDYQMQATGLSHFVPAQP